MSKEFKNLVIAVIRLLAAMVEAVRAIARKAKLEALKENMDINAIKAELEAKQEVKIIYRHKESGMELSQFDLENDTITNKNNWTAVIVAKDHKLKG